MIIAQNRNGDTGIVRLKFNGEYSKFENLDD
ncbi:MAG: DnaB-like helicase C-terminal domain-containing protein [Bacteroides uniformis]